MDRIMLVMDDFTELQFLSSVLQKIGFDVASFNKDASVGSTALGFAPGLLIATARGRAVDGAQVASKIRKQIPGVKTILIYPQGQNHILTDEIKKEADAFVESPLEPSEVLPVIAQLLKRTDAQALIEKYKKMMLLPQFADRRSTGGGAAATNDRPLTVREQRYQKFLDAHDDNVDQTLSMDVLHKASVQEAAGQSEADKSQHELKKEFVRTLFKK